MIECKKTIKELGVTLEKLYNNDYQINVHLSDKDFTFYVMLKDVRDQIDCKLSSYKANMWTRTKAGIEYRKYTRIQDLQSAVKKEIRRKVETEGEITFSLSTVIGLM